MPQAQSKSFPGYGVVYPGGGNRGIKVVKTFTQGQRKMVNPDGSISYDTPPPTIHELHGGGFCYADGRPVTNRQHLENITVPDMKERALVWFEKHGQAISPSDIVMKEEVEKGRPEPDFIRSDEIPQETDEVTEKLNDQMQNSLSAIAQSIQALTNMVKNQDERLAKLETSPQPEPEKKPKNLRSRQSEKMKAKWADPEYKAKMMKRIHGKGEVEGESV